MTMPSWLRRLYMRSTSLSIPGAGSRRYVRWFYRAWAWFYDWSVALDGAFEANARRMVDQAVHDGDRVLDIGVGTGLLATLCVGRAGAYTRLDYSGDMLAQAAQKMARGRWSNVSLRWGDARGLPFEDDSFDAVVSSFVLPHFAPDEKIELLEEAARVLGPGGRLGLFLAQGEVAPLFATRSVLSDLLERAGFEEVSIEDRDDVYRVVTASRRTGAA